MFTLTELSSSYGPARVRNATIRRRVIVAHPHGLHLRVCLAVVQTARQHQAKVTLHKDGQAEDATSILGLLSLGAAPGTILTVSATGPDASEAVEAVADLLTANGEETVMPDSAW